MTTSLYTSGDFWWRGGRTRRMAELGVEGSQTQAGKGGWAMWREQAWGRQARAAALEVPGPSATKDQDQVFVHLCWLSFFTPREDLRTPGRKVINISTLQLKHHPKMLSQVTFRTFEWFQSFCFAQLSPTSVNSCHSFSHGELEWPKMQMLGGGNG